MASPEAQRALQRAGVESLEPQEALAALGRLMAAPPTQCAVARLEPSRFREVFELKGRRPFLERLQPAAHLSGVDPTPAAASAGSGLRRQLQQAPAGEQLRLLGAYLQAQVAAILGFAEPQAVPAQSGFFELGMDSLMAVELKNRLAAELALPLRSTLAFDFPTVSKLFESF